MTALGWTPEQDPYMKPEPWYQTAPWKTIEYGLLRCTTNWNQQGLCWNHLQEKYE